MSEVALQLGGFETAAAQHIAEKFPTSALAVLRVSGDWQRLEPGAATLTDFHVPR